MNLAVVVDVDDPGMVQRRERACLGPEPRAEGRVDGSVGAQDLHRDGTAEYAIRRAPYLAHTAGGDLFVQPVAAGKRFCPGCIKDFYPVIGGSTREIVVCHVAGLVSTARSPRHAVAAPYVQNLSESGHVDGAGDDAVRADRVEPTAVLDHRLAQMQEEPNPWRSRRN